MSSSKKLLSGKEAGAIIRLYQRIYGARGRQISEKLGISESLISSIRNGRRESISIPTMKTILSLVPEIEDAYYRYENP